MERKKNRDHDEVAGERHGRGMPAWLFVVVFLVVWGAFWFSPQLIGLARLWAGW